MQKFESIRATIIQWNNYPSQVKIYALEVSKNICHNNKNRDAGPVCNGLGSRSYLNFTMNLLPKFFN